METTKPQTLIAKTAVTLISLVALALHVFSDKHFDVAGLVLVFFALLPWLGSIISRAELPGGWRVDFQVVKAEQLRQAKEIDALKFLVSNFLTDAEYRHLEGLAAEKPYHARLDSTSTFFEIELRRLRALGVIQGRPNCGARSLREAMNAAHGKEVDVKDHFEITARGRDYLRLRNEMVPPSPNLIADST